MMTREPWELNEISLEGWDGTCSVVCIHVVTLGMV
jgi:hypothetical protein